MPTLRVGSVGLHYELAGQGEPLLFIHGLGSSIEDWAPQISAFASRYRVLAFDVRGHGRSDKPAGPYSVPLFAADTAALLDALSIGPAHVVGISMGGMIALQLLADFPERVRSITIVNSGPALILRTFAQKLGILQRFAIVRALGMRRMGKVLSGRLFPDPQADALRATFIERWARNDKRAYLDSMRALIGWSVADKLPRMSRPALVIAAEHDYTPVAAHRAWAATLPGARVTVMPGAHHAVPMEKPDDFNAVLGEFLASISPASLEQVEVR